MCNLYAITKSQEAIRQAAKALRDKAGNLPPAAAARNISRSYGPDCANGRGRQARAGNDALGLSVAADIRQSGPSTNVRNVKSSYWKRWLQPEQRCLVPSTSFCEYQDKPDPKTKRKTPHWFALSDKRPIFFFAGIWRPWTSTRGTKADSVEGDHVLFSFLTCDSNKVVEPVHAKAMPVILTTKEEYETWLTAPVEKALKLQRPLADKLLKVVATGEKMDAA